MSLRRPALRLLWWEAAFALAYESWVGPIYLSGLAGMLGVPIAWVTWVTALPWLGSLGQVVGIWGLGRARSLKRYSLWLAGIARASWLLPLAAAAIWTLRGEFAAERAGTWFGLVAITAFFAALLGSSSAMAWMSWVSEIVPVSLRGRFFGARQRFVTVGTMTAHAAAMFFLGRAFDGGAGRGYGMLGALAVVSAAVSTFLLAKVPDARPRTGRIAPAVAVRAALADPVYARTLIAVALFAGTLQIGGPYFPYYFTHEVGLSMGEVAFWVFLTHLGALLASGFWGRQIDQGAGPERVLWCAATFYVFSPLPYLSRSAEFLRWVGPLEYFINGFAFAGYTLGLTTLIMRVAPAGRNSVHFSIYTAACGLASALGAILGGKLAVWLAPWGGFRALWVVTSLARALGVVGLWMLASSLAGARKGMRSSEICMS